MINIVGYVFMDFFFLLEIYVLNRLLDNKKCIFI